MVKKIVVGLIVAAAAVLAVPATANAAEVLLSTSASEESPSQAGTSASAGGPIAGTVPAIAFWAGAGVVGLTGGMVSVASIRRRQRIATAGALGPAEAAASA